MNDSLNERITNPINYLVSVFEVDGVTELAVERSFKFFHSFFVVFTLFLFGLEFFFNLGLVTLDQIACLFG